jgi:hypothetical protein
MAKTLGDVLRFKSIYRDKPRQTKIQTTQIKGIRLQDGLNGLLEPFAAEADAIYNNGNLSESGKKNACYDLLAKRVLPAVDAFLKESQGIFLETLGLWNKLQKSLEQFNIDKSDISAALARREIREHFMRQKDAYERGKLFQQQIGKGNLLAYQAVREMNDFFGIVDGKDLVEAETVLMVNADPQAALCYYDAVKACVHLQMGMNELAGQLSSHVKGLKLEIGDLERLPDLLLPGMDAEKTEAALVAAVEKVSKQ